MLAFEEKEDALVAHAERPLRVHNDALGYELTYHLSEYVLRSARRMRFGLVEFDTLEAQSPQQRQAWREARLETYRGSFDHFIDALRADALAKEGFIVSITEKISESKTMILSGNAYPETRDRLSRVTDAAEIFTFTRVPAGAFSLFPRPGI